MIKFENVSKSISLIKGKKSILKNASFCLPAKKNCFIATSEVVSRDVMLNLIGKTEKPNKGKVTHGLRVSWLAQQVKFARNASIPQFIRFLGRICQYPDVYGLQDEVKDLLYNENILDLDMKELSGPQKRELSLAITLALQFDTLLMNGYPKFQDKSINEHFDTILEKISKEQQMIISVDKNNRLESHFDVGLVVEDGAAELVYDYDEFQTRIETFEV